MPVPPVVGGELTRQAHWVPVDLRPVRLVIKPSQA